MIFTKPTKYDITFFFILVTIVGLVWSKFLISQGIIWLSVISVFSWDSKKKFPIYLNPQFLFVFSHLRHFIPELSMIGLILIAFLGGIGSTDTDYWMEKVRIRLPFLAFPLIMLILPKMNKKHFYLLLLIFSSILTFTALGAVINFLFHYDLMIQMIGKGQSIPVPLHHIRFSLLLSYSIFINFYLFKQLRKEQRFWSNYALVLGIIAIICLHILSVRSGLAVFYVLSILYLFRAIFIKKKYLLGFGLIILLTSLPFVFYQFNSSFNTKMNYSKWDLGQFMENNGQNYSDSERLTSIIVGIDIYKDHPLFGIGTGDVNNEVKRIYKEKYPAYEYAKLPHNQLVVTLASNGIVGLILFLGIYFFPIFYRKGYKDFLVTALSITVFLSFLVESTFETSQGVTMYAFLFSFIFITHSKILAEPIIYE